ncbi:hypothetical protein [Clostridium intestinale]|uniref:Uncharacterized protein n=1 Tax=Clostridium intestinale URNW TaxID=1294142 RepID=U2NMY3_9CLOT|nr:hypothetical protein [Clostridium intestinale]ERK30518.1 hypothetical protein CINTURNW_2274 [Clostridium intestinale URNW]
MDFLREQGLIFTSKKYEGVYISLNERYDISYDQLFTLCAVIGFKNNRYLEIESKGRQFRGSYLKMDSRASLYSIILNDTDFGKQIDSFENNEYQKKCTKKLEKYAEGGMEILVEEVFRGKWGTNKLDERYDEYIIDIISYVYEKSGDLPF